MALEPASEVVAAVGVARSRLDRGAVRVGALLTVVAVLAWVVLVGRASGAGVGLAPPTPMPRPAGPGPATVAEDDDPHQLSGERAVAALRAALRARGLAAGVVDGTMSAARYDAQHETDGSQGFWPRGAWLVSSGAGEWWVWSNGAATPADQVARAVSARIVPITPPGGRAVAGARGADALADLGGFLATWGLFALATVLPGAIPALATYGAGHRSRFAARGAPVHRLLFALGSGAPWLVAGAAIHLGGLSIAAAFGAVPALATRAPAGLALGLAALALHRVSPLGEGAVLAGRRSGADWAARAGRGRRDSLRAGWAHGTASVGAGGGLVAVLVLGGAALPWALAVAVLLFAERVLPHGDRTARAAGVVLLALTLLAAAWPTPVLAALRGTITGP